MAKATNSGLTDTAQKDWPKMPAKALEMKPVDWINQNPEVHTRVLDYLVQRLNFSERKMKQFYARWSVAEAKVQAYIQYNDYEQTLKDLNKDSKEPNAVPIIVPYCYASQATISTYLLHTFAGRKPMFQIGAHKAESVQPARNMETVLQWNSDSVRMVKNIWQYSNDSMMYGLAINFCGWKKDTGIRTVWKETPSMMSMLGQAPQKKRVREEKIVFEGNDVGTIDPYMFFPDPRVPMTEVARRGEFVFWRSFDGKHDLKREEMQGRIKYVNAIPDTPTQGRNAEGGDEEPSSRSILSEGDPMPGHRDDYMWKGARFIQRDQGTCWIIPAELGIGKSTKVELWMFTIGNKQRIIQAEPFEADHGMHPVSVTEPFSLGYGFGQPGLHDYNGPIQDTMSWFVNSHMHNIRTALNNMFVVDPSMVEMQDLKNPKPGKIIRLKRAALGQDVRAALQQLQVTDVTRSHMSDLNTFMRIGDALQGLNENLRGQQDAGGRKTATEVRTSGEAAASRLAALARVMSAQGLVDLTEQMCLNTQQYMTQEFFLQVVGQNAAEKGLHIAPEHIVGDFNFPVHDGTLPLDRVALLDVWKELWLAVAQNEQLSAKYDAEGIFEHIAELGGAKNLEQFKRQEGQMPPGAETQIQGDEQVAAQAQAGNLVPVSSPSIGVNERPAQRAAQAQAGRP